MPPVFCRTSSPSGLLPCFPSLQFTITQSRATGIADHILPLGDLLDLKSGLSGLKSGLPGLKYGLSGLKFGLSDLKFGLSGFKSGLSGLKPGFSGFKLSL